jgi:hypothetical protein
MKTLILLMLLTGAMARAESLLIAEQFNDSSGRVEFKSGAKLGAAGSGVSGQPTDRSYVAELARTEIVDVAPVGGLADRSDRDKHPDAIGNTGNPKYNRPVNGSIDDLRIVSKALDDSALEKIRQADLKNEQPPGF